MAEIFRIHLGDQVSFLLGVRNSLRDACADCLYRYIA